MSSAAKCINIPTQCLLIDSCGYSVDQLLQHFDPTQQAVRHCAFDQATEYLSQSAYDLIFLHTCYTDTNALSELHYLRQQHPDIPVIIFDQELSSERIEEFTCWRANDYLQLQDLTQPLLQQTIRHGLTVRQLLKEINHLNQVDPLTGMTNRHQFYKQLSSQLRQFRQGQSRPDTNYALLNVDLDGFRRFNHINGYAAGDKIVKEMAGRLIELAPGLIARLGNDEFVLLIDCPADDDCAQAATLLCYQIMHALAEPYHYRDLEIILPCSIGVSFAPQRSCETDTLIHQATQARLKAKQQSTCSYSMYTQEPQSNKELSPVIEPDLMNALRRQEFELYYQPRIDIASGRIIGAEALIRWNHPEKGLIFPDAFISTAERTGLIVPIGYWVIQQAGEDINRLKDAGLDITHLSVNLSFRQFQDSYLCRTIERLIDRYNIDTNILEFELTESALFNNEAHVLESIEQLHKLGINFSLDDFGTGYSSFSLLQTLPISSLKIDRSFVSHIHENQDNREIVKALIRLAHSLKKEIIAEGVETPQQLDFLASYGCHQAQGYLYSKPIPFDQYCAMLHQSINSTAANA
ncbi:MAG: EAL domain-containing protein [Amphritea sp.]|nr:EAL domain-containing protein [Amphritea sp.]